MGGRRAMPIDLLLINGNKNKLTKSEIDQRKKAEAKIKPSTDKVRPPSWLSAAGKREFRKLVMELQQTELITNVDVNQLAAYCRVYERYVELQAGTPAVDEIGDPKLDEEGNPIIEYNEKAIDTYLKHLKTLAVEFGLTPSARAKIAMPKKEEKEKSTEEQMFGEV